MLGVRNPEHGMDPRFAQKNEKLFKSNKSIWDHGTLSHMMIMVAWVAQTAWTMSASFNCIDTVVARVGCLPDHNVDNS